MIYNTYIARQMVRRTETGGVEPKVPTEKDVRLFEYNEILNGEMFLNTADNKLWIRSENDIIEFSLMVNKKTQIIETLDDTPTSINIDVNKDCSYNMEIRGVAALQDGTTTTMYGQAAVMNDGSDTIVLDDTLAVVYDGITIGGVQMVGSVGHDICAIEITGLIGTGIRWAFDVEWTEIKHQIP
jgi:hypothetical protein